MSTPTHNDLPLVDAAYLQSVQDAVGAAAMAGLIEAMLKDARQTADLLRAARTRDGARGEAREAHRLGGLFAQFGCPALALALKEAAHAESNMVASMSESALALLAPTLAGLAALYDAETAKA